jgi:hypothetical protein
LFFAEGLVGAFFIVKPSSSSSKRFFFGAYLTGSGLIAGAEGRLVFLVGAKDDSSSSLNKFFFTGLEASTLAGCFLGIIGASS